MNERPETPARKVSLAELEPVIREAFAAGMTFKLPVTGTSNLPTLAEGRDQIILDEAAAPLRKYDLPLYRRDNGQYVLHRIVAVEKDGCYICCGDHQWQRERGIRPDQVIGVTVQLVRKGRLIPVTAFKYRLWIRIWVLLLPCRSVLIRVSSALRRRLPGRFSPRSAE